MVSPDSSPQAGGPRAERRLKIAYLVNQYPHVSHSFIRREIAGVEAQGVTVERFSIRRPPVNLVDPADVAEQKRTRVLLGAGPIALLVALLGAALKRPRAFLGAWARRCASVAAPIAGSCDIGFTSPRPVSCCAG